VGGIVPPDPLPEPADPTVACARCDSTEVYLTAENATVCAQCGAVLEVELTEIHPG
jgi:transcription initiation factor TFIIIB Brf1 subunit/transcription initiation factor TFIIB